MAKIFEIVPVTDLRNDAAEALGRAERGHELLCLLAWGEKEIAAGLQHSLASVLAEADALLEQ